MHEPELPTLRLKPRPRGAPIDVRSICPRPPWPSTPAAWVEAILHVTWRPFYAITVFGTFCYFLGLVQRALWHLSGWALAAMGG